MNQDDKDYKRQIEKAIQLFLEPLAGKAIISGKANLPAIKKP